MDRHINLTISKFREMRSLYLISDLRKSDRILIFIGPINTCPKNVLRDQTLIIMAFFLGTKRRTKTEIAKTTNQGRSKVNP